MTPPEPEQIMNMEVSIRHGRPFALPRRCGSARPLSSDPGAGGGVRVRGSRHGGGLRLHPGARGSVRGARRCPGRCARLAARAWTTLWSSPDGPGATKRSSSRDDPDPGRMSVGDGAVVAIRRGGHRPWGRRQRRSGPDAAAGIRRARRRFRGRPAARAHGRSQRGAAAMAGFNFCECTGSFRPARARPPDPACRIDPQPGGASRRLDAGAG